MKISEPEINAAAIRYACRRGMLELDLMLQRFFEQKFETLSQDEQRHFARLLQESDPQLWDWLSGDVQPTQHEFLHLVQLIRS